MINSVLTGDYKEGEIKISFEGQETAKKFLGLVYLINSSLGGGINVEKLVAS